MDIVKLQDSELKDIYEKSIKTIIRRMVEVNLNEFAIDSFDDIIRYQIRWVILKLYQLDESLIQLPKEEFKKHVLWNIKKIREIADDEIN